jgi:hypothetical protein
VGARHPAPDALRSVRGVLTLISLFTVLFTERRVPDY